VRRLLFALFPLLVAAESGAQVVRRGGLGGAPPTLWVSGGAALAEGWSVTDGTTGSRWDFGSSTQYQASLERMFNGATFGLRGTYATVPLRYNSTDADADVSQLFLAVHVAPGRPGFHSVLELDGGATMYSNFRARATGAKLGPDRDADFSFAFGYGFGYGFSNAFSVEVVRDLTMTMHQKTGLAASEDSMHRINSTRIVGRFGLGG
jgi:hypothetical protein